MITTNSVQPSELVTRIMRLDHNIKNKPKKITMYNSQLTKVIRDKLEKKNKLEKRDKKEKKCRFENNKSQIWHKKKIKS